MVVKYVRFKLSVCEKLNETVSQYKFSNKMETSFLKMMSQLQISSGTANRKKYYWRLIINNFRILATTRN
jgi:hypothetical protein